jgi:hypothetical protein
MSYVVDIRRTIPMTELQTALASDPAFRITRHDDETLDIEWSDKDEILEIDFRKGQLSATSPSDDAYRALCLLGERLGADVIGEEDLIPRSYASDEIKRGIFANRTTWIGWPVLVLLLSGLLVWRW